MSRGHQRSTSTVISMSDMNAVFPSSFELWEFVLAFEDGSLPAETWNDRALAVVAIWYLFQLPPADAIERVQGGLERNHLSFRQPRGANRGGIDALTEVWPIVLRHVLESFGDRNPLAVANRLMECGVRRARTDRAA